MSDAPGEEEAWTDPWDDRERFLEEHAEDPHPEAEVLVRAEEGEEPEVGAPGYFGEDGA